MMSNNYFKLFACCIPVKGAKRAIICDLQRTSFKFVPNSLVEILEELKIKSIQEIKNTIDNDDRIILEDYLNFLVENEYGFFCSKEDLHLFPEINFSLPDPKESTAITNAIIDVSPDSKHDFNKILAELESLGCKHLQIRSYDQLDFIELAEVILQNLENSQFQSIDFLGRYYNELEELALINLIVKFPRLNEIILHSSPNKKIVNDPYGMGSLIYITDTITSNQHCGIISPYYFSINLSAFSLSKIGNSCLSGKISLDMNGNIKNCPSMMDSFGNIKTISFKEALQSNGFRKFWSITKDQIEICKDCEFRYICTDCRAFTKNNNTNHSKPSKCSYDPYTGLWNDVNKL